MRSILVTGGLGFIGSACIRKLLSKECGFTGSVVNLDVCSYAAQKESLLSVADDTRYTFVQGDIRNGGLLRQIIREFSIDTIIHFAAESHVDRSIEGPRAFLETNVVGTFEILEVLREMKSIRFHHVSTDEVFGSLKLQEGSFHEGSPYAPNSPYSASKAASDHFVRAYIKTYGIKATISHCGNNYGPFQYSEKLIPVVINSLIEKKKIPIYGNGKNIRDWIYVDDHVRGILHILRHGEIGQSYNIGSKGEKNNLEIVQMIIRAYARMSGESENELARFISFVEDRKGHDFRYSLSTQKLENLGWKPEVGLEEGLTLTTEWYMRKKRGRVICVIPARLHSTRLPKKILAPLIGKPLLQHTYMAALQCPQFDEVVFAIDDEETASVLESINAPFFMTSKECQSGSDRLLELQKRGRLQADIWVNWQCDDPFITRDMIEQLLSGASASTEAIWTLRKEIHSEEEKHSPHVVKVVTDSSNRALYFSRLPIPFYREGGSTLYKHIGIYAYSDLALQKMQKLTTVSPLENAEKLEQLRFMEGGIAVYALSTTQESFGIDIPEDLEKAKEFLLKKECALAR